MTTAANSIPHIRWRWLIVCGVVWALLLCTVQSLQLPILELSADQTTPTLGAMFLGWIPAGVLLACLGRVLAPYLSASLAYGAAVAAAPFLGGLYALTRSVLRPFFQVQSFDASFFNGLGDNFPYVAWSAAVYSAPLLAGILVVEKTLRMRSLVAEARIARQRASLAVEESQLAMYRGQIRPDLLLDAAGRMQELYRTDVEAADALFQKLTAFLHSAMPSLRTGVSTLPAELKTASDFAALWNACAPEGPTWRVDIVSDVPMTSFPPLAIVPAMDSLARALPSSAQLQLHAARARGGFQICLNSTTVASHWPDAETERNIRGVLTGLAAAGAALHFSRAAPASAPLFEIHLNLPASDQGLQPQPALETMQWRTV